MLSRHYGSQAHIWCLVEIPDGVEVCLCSHDQMLVLWLLESMSAYTIVVFGYVYALGCLGLSAMTYRLICACQFFVALLYRVEGECVVYVFF